MLKHHPEATAATKLTSGFAKRAMLMQTSPFGGLSLVYKDVSDYKKNKKNNSDKESMCRTEGASTSVFQFSSEVQFCR